MFLPGKIINQEKTRLLPFVSFAGDQKRETNGGNKTKGGETIGAEDILLSSLLTKSPKSSTDMNLKKSPDFLAVLVSANIEG